MGLVDPILVEEASNIPIQSDVFIVAIPVFVDGNLNHICVLVLHFDSYVAFPATEDIDGCYFVEIIT